MKPFVFALCVGIGIFATGLRANDADPGQDKKCHPAEDYTGDYVVAEGELPLSRLMPEAKIRLQGAIHFHPAQTYSDPIFGKGALTCYLAKLPEDEVSQFSNLSRTLPGSAEGKEELLLVMGPAKISQSNRAVNIVKDNSEYDFKFNIYGRLNFSVAVSSTYDHRNYFLTCVTAESALDAGGQTGPIFSVYSGDRTVDVSKANPTPPNIPDTLAVKDLPASLVVELKADPSIPKCEDVEAKPH